MKNKSRKIWIDNHEARIKALESICTSNDSSKQLIKNSKEKGIKSLKWYLILLLLFLQMYIIIRIAL